MLKIYIRFILKDYTFLNVSRFCEEMNHGPSFCHQTNLVTWFKIWKLRLAKLTYLRYTSADTYVKLHFHAHQKSSHLSSKHRINTKNMKSLLFARVDSSLAEFFSTSKFSQILSQQVECFLLTLRTKLYIERNSCAQLWSRLLRSTVLIYAFAAENWRGKHANLNANTNKSNLVF